MPDNLKEIVIVEESTIRNKIYEVRGMKVMLDFELAEIYGYTTKAFNQQVKNNEAKFDEDFRFRLTREDIDTLMRSKILPHETTIYSKDNPEVLVIFHGLSPSLEYICS